METRRNPDVLSNITTLAVIGAVGVLAYEVTRIKFPEFHWPPLPTFPGFGQPAWLPGGGYVDPNPTKVNLPGSFKDLSTLNADIDAWFNGAGGFLGIGSYDPTSWTAFTAKMTVNPASLFFITYDPSTFPKSPTAYFLQKSGDWALSHQSVNPYGPGYHG